MGQYLVAIHRPQGYDGTAEDEAMRQDIGALNREMVAAGVRVFVGGLRPVAEARAVRRQAGDAVAFTDGPYLEAKEFVGGFWVLECAGIEDALEWGGRRRWLAGRGWRFGRFMRCQDDAVDLPAATG